ncbi:MAG: P1 family peptidase [Alphaproteobacteria bacterium]
MTAHFQTPSGRSRARALPVPFDGAPGLNNAITDVAGVSVGYQTLVHGDGPRVVGEGPVRTGVTAILPRPRAMLHVPCFAGSYSLNGNGELTGLAWVEESGQVQWPITITNTHSCGVARDATIKWAKRNCPQAAYDWLLPVAGETCDAELNDIDGFHVTDTDVFAAIDAATDGPIEQGSVGGGTGMICYDFKGGSGSASRIASVEGQSYTVGVFVQANFGIRRELRIAGQPVGKHMPGGEVRSKPAGSIIAVLATDAPLLPHQVKRLARRIPLGIARTGTISHDGSGDIFIAFSTVEPAGEGALLTTPFLRNDSLDPLFEAAVQATEEAIVDSMVANATMTGCDGTTVYSIDHAVLSDLLSRGLY